MGRYVLEAEGTDKRYVLVDNEPTPDVTTEMERFTRGIYDPFEGGAQLLYNALPQSLRSAGDKLNNYIADKTGLVPRIEGDFNQSIAQGEQDYQARRGQQSDSMDWMRLGGNVASPANLFAASRGMTLAKPVEQALSKVMPQTAAKTAGASVGGAAGASAQTAMMPVTEGDYATEKAKQIGTGAAVGASLPYLSKLIPQRTAEAARLMAEGVRVPVGQQLGGVFRRMEDRLQSWPLLGDAIRNARINSIDDFNEATWNKVLEPVGLKLPKGKQGRDAVAWVQEQIGKKYDAVLPNLAFKADAQVATDMAQLRQLVSTLPPEKAVQFDKIIDYYITSRATPQGNMSGVSYKDALSGIKQDIRAMSGSNDIWDRKLADALREVQDIYASALERQNPMYAPALKRIHLAQAMEYRPERAAASLGAQDGKFTPAQLTNATKALDYSKGKRSFAKGEALMQDWAESGKNTLSQTIPDSGTAERVMAGAGGVGGAMYGGSQFGIPWLPEVAALYGGLSLPYLPVGRNIASGLVGASDDFANSLAARPGYAAPLFYPAGYSLLGGSQ